MEYFVNSACGAVFIYCLFNTTDIIKNWIEDIKDKKSPKKIIRRHVVMSMQTGGSVPHRFWTEENPELEGIESIKF